MPLSCLCVLNMKRESISLAQMLETVVKQLTQLQPKIKCPLCNSLTNTSQVLGVICIKGKVYKQQIYRAKRLFPTCFHSLCKR